MVKLQDENKKYMDKTTKKILIVEDEKPLAKALELKLGRSGFLTKTAFSGMEALEALKQESFDVIILDLIMPQMDGFHVLEELKKLQISIPVIVTSNLGQDEDRQRAKELGAIDYFIKTNIPPSGIVENIKKLLSQ